MKWRALIPIAFLAAGAPAYAAPPDQIYTLNCWGCHQPHAQGIPGSVPRLANSMGYFLYIPEGRSYLAEVPGVAASPLSDVEIAQVLNWMLLTFSRSQLPGHFVPYAAAEIREYRAHKMANVTDTRRRLAAKLQSMGLKVAQDSAQASSGSIAPASVPISVSKIPAPK
jgi:mono/diheme cytochrome c family protein